MFGFKKKEKEIGAAYRYPMWKQEKGFDEALVIASFAPALVNGFGTPVRKQGTLYDKWGAMAEEQKEGFRARFRAAKKNREAGAISILTGTLGDLEGRN
jgi:hypothetical protein